MIKPLWTSEELCRLFSTNETIPLHQPITGISIDSRTLLPGDLFVALKGPIYDGHAYIAHAHQQGAGAALVEQPSTQCDTRFPQICVDNTDHALQQLAHAARRRAVDTKIIGVTGSYGKSTCREALRHILSQQGPTHATQRNFNNHWGVPLSVARMHPDCAYAVFEMGMNNAGEMTALSALVQPNSALITTIGDAHIGKFGSLDKIADAKAEIFTGMTKGNTVILNRDMSQYHQLYTQAKRLNLKVLSFGQHQEADCRLMHFEFDQQYLKIDVSIDGHALSFHINVLSDHWAVNMTGVLACVYALGADITKAAQDLSSFLPLEGRGALINIAYQQDYLYVIDDTYNAGPHAMHAALKALGQLKPTMAGRRIAILGDMDANELGTFNIQEHKNLKNHIMDNPIDHVFLYGPSMKYLNDILPDSLKNGHFLVLADLIKHALPTLQPGDCILVKGARGQRAYDGIMQMVVHALQSLSQQPLLKVCL